MGNFTSKNSKLKTGYGETLGYDALFTCFMKECYEEYGEKYNNNVGNNDVNNPDSIQLVPFHQISSLFYQFLFKYNRFPIPLFGNFDTITYNCLLSYKSRPIEEQVLSEEGKIITVVRNKTHINILG